VGRGRAVLRGVIGVQVGGEGRAGGTVNKPKEGGERDAIAAPRVQV
jgi:hypothetical protein